MRGWIVLGSFAAAAAAMAFVPPIAQDPAYHDFADARRIFGFPNFFNVASNVFFLAVAALGSVAASQIKRASLYGLVFSGVGLTAIGSAWYHMAPDDASLVWDRVPMVISITALLAAVIEERISEWAGVALALPMVAAGVASVFWWRATGDLRPYVLAEYYPAFAIPLILVLYKPRYTESGHLWATLALYGVAKFFEMSDRTIFNLGHIVSGHTLKHVFAAAALFCIVRMLRRRKIIQP